MFISVIALAMSVMAMATETAYVELRLTGNSGLYDEMTLTEDDSYTSAYEDGADAEKIMYQANTRSVLIYGLVDGLECGDVAAANLDGLAIGFKTNMIDQNYTLSFEVAEGRELKLYDRVTKTTTTITEGASYAFSVEAAQVGQVEVNNRFVLGLPSYSVTMNAYGWASFSSADDLAIPAGLTAYKGAYAGEVLNLNEVDNIKANEGVILYGNAGQTYELELGNGSSDFAGNNLKPASAWENHSGTVYVLHDEALYQYTGANFPANKAYLEIPVSAGAPRRISFRFNGTTALENAELNEAKAVKFVENGQVFIRRGNEVFNLQGQIVK
jgi:hypothetical protein